MTLAADRSLAAANRLAAGGIDWWRIRVVAAGSGERVEPFPEDAAADAKNARVEVRVLDEIAAPREPAKSGESGDARKPGIRIDLDAPKGGQDSGGAAAPAGAGSGGAAVGSASGARDAPSGGRTRAP